MRSLARQYTGRLLARVAWEVERAIAAAQQQDRLDSRPRLLLCSGVEVPVDIPYHRLSGHEFHQLARAALNLAPNVSLVLLRPGPGTFEHREVPCYRSGDVGNFIRRKTFQAIPHA